MHGYAPLATAVVEQCRYGIVTHKVPERIGQKNASLVDGIAHFIKAESVPLLDAIVALAPQGRWARRSTSIELYCFGRFRSTFAALNSPAEVLAPYYSEYLTLPVVLPIIISKAEIGSVVHSDWFRYITRVGVLVYSRIEE
jgi:hypothetical protein